VTESGRLEPVDDSVDALLVRTGQGDREAFEILYDRFVPRVFGLVRKVVRDPTLSRDTTQDVLTELWRTAPRFDPERGNAVAWILTLAHRRAVDTVRREQSARDRADVVGRREDAQRPFDDVSEAVTMSDEHAQVRRALDVLTDLQRQAIKLAYFDGMTYREVSERLDVPLGTIKTRMRDGMIRLRDALEVAT
jgi:RNA polymerase sigma-70 factor, ECF subfamily